MPTKVFVPTFDAMLIDGERLCDLLKDLKLGVRTEQVEHVALTPEFFEGV